MKDYNILLSECKQCVSKRKANKQSNTRTYHKISQTNFLLYSLVGLSILELL